MELIEIQMIITKISRQWIDFLINRIDIRKFLSIVEIDLPHRGNYHTACFGTVNGMSTIVSQTISSTISHECMF